MMMNRLPVPYEEPPVKRRVRRKNGAFTFFIILLICAVALFVLYPVLKDRGVSLRGLFGKTESSSETEPPPAESTGIYEFDRSSVEPGMIPVVPVDKSAYASGIFYINGTDLEISGSRERVTPLTGGKVIVLCTHPYEAYLPSAVTGASPDGKVTSGNGEATVVRAAEALVKSLRENGIDAFYMDTGNTSGISSYASAREKLDEYIKDGSISLIIDVHRQLLTDSGDNLRPVALYGGKMCAQLGFAVGTDASGEEHEGWERQLALADAAFSVIYGKAPALVMPTRISISRLNQHLGVPMLTLEIGSAWNAAEEAVNSAEAAGKLLPSLFAD